MTHFELIISRLCGKPQGLYLPAMFTCGYETCAKGSSKCTVSYTVHISRVASPKCFYAGSTCPAFEQLLLSTAEASPIRKIRATNITPHVPPSGEAVKSSSFFSQAFLMSAAILPRNMTLKLLPVPLSERERERGVR